MSLDEIKRKRAEDVTQRDKVLDSVKKELKDRNQKKIEKKLAVKKNKPSAPKGKDIGAKATANMKGGKGKASGGNTGGKR